MTISVLMSTYYRENPIYLDRALKSIWTDQIRKPDQIVLVEDGRLTPALDKVVEKWGNTIGKSLTIVRNECNQGLAEALNDGIKRAKGELIARMDSDDIATPNRFKLQEAYMENHENVDILGGSIREFNDMGTLNQVRYYPRTMEEVRKGIYKASPLAHPTVMFRRRFFDDGFRYSSKFYICEDVILWFEALKADREINNLPDILLRFRRNDSMMNRRGRKKAWSEFLAYCSGIYMLDGLFTYKYIFSLIRLVFRLSPSWFIKSVYNGTFRNKFTASK